MVYKFVNTEENKLQLMDEGRLWTKKYDVFLTHNGSCKPILRVNGKKGSASSQYTNITNADKIMDVLHKKGVKRKKLQNVKLPDSIDKRVIAGWFNILDWLERC